MVCCAGKPLESVDYRFYENKYGKRLTRKAIELWPASILTKLEDRLHGKLASLQTSQTDEDIRIMVSYRNADLEIYSIPNLFIPY